MAMHNLISRLMVVVVLAFPLAVKAPSAPSSGPTFVTFSSPQTDQWIETQSVDYPNGDPSGWVRNLTGCTWDVDDHWHLVAKGTWNPGYVASVTRCHIAEPVWGGITQRHLLASVTAPESTLVVRVCSQPTNTCQTATPVWNSSDRLYHYEACIRYALDENASGLVTIPNSNGGIGRPSDHTVTVTNPSTRPVRKVEAYADYRGFGWYPPIPCALVT